MAAASRQLSRTPSSRTRAREIRVESMSVAVTAGDRGYQPTLTPPQRGLGGWRRGEQPVFGPPRAQPDGGHRMATTVQMIWRALLLRRGAVRAVRASTPPRLGRGPPGTPPAARLAPRLGRGRGPGHASPVVATWRHARSASAARARSANAAICTRRRFHVVSSPRLSRKGSRRPASSAAPSSPGRRIAQQIGGQPGDHLGVWAARRRR